MVYYFISFSLITLVSTRTPRTFAGGPFIGTVEGG